MKKPILLSLVALLFFACAPKQTDFRPIKQNISAGELNLAQKQTDSLMAGEKLSGEDSLMLQRLSDSIRLIRTDFRKTRQDILAYIAEVYPDFPYPTKEKLDEWEKAKVLEYRMIDGQKRYFTNAAPNIFRLDKTAVPYRLAKFGNSEEASDVVVDENEKQIIKEKQRAGDGAFVAPVTMTVDYTITLRPGIVPKGDTIYAWLPYPRRDVERQKDVEFLYASEDNYIIAPDSAVHSSIFLKVPSRGNEPTPIKAGFKFTAYAQSFNLSEMAAKPYDTESTLFKKYTAQEPPHLSFTDKKRKLAEKIVGDEQNPIKKAELIFDYIRNNYPWASAVNYGLIADIPNYVLENYKGDCGQVALLFINLCRISGIPARWQSGWMMHPGEVNFHDWAEIYIEDLGWIPVDVSFGRKKHLTSGGKFFFGGMDSYRLYLNSSYSSQLYPPKKHLRIDEVDFQRGELETKDRMIIHTDYSFSMKVNYEN